MATLASLTLDVEDMLYGQTPLQRPDIDTLAAAVASSATTSFRFSEVGTQFWGRGDYAEYDDGAGTAGEVVRLLEDGDDVDFVSVKRGQRQTSAATSFAAGSIFIKNPPFTRTEIQRAINEVIDSDLQNGIWYRSERSIAWTSGRNRYPGNASDFTIERMYQLDTGKSSLGAATYDETGGAAEDLWTLASHGLAVNDTVRFSAAGTGATGYSSGIIYYVASVPSANTFTLSATESGSAIEGTDDSVGTWTLEKVAFNYREFPSYYWDYLTNVNTAHESTGTAVLVHNLYTSDDTIYYVARTRPSSSAIASLPTEIANLVPWGAVARLVGGTAVRHRYDPNSAASTTPYVDAEFFRVRFEGMVQETRNRLLRELTPMRKWVWGPTHT